MTFCTSCGKKNESEANFCEACGYQITIDLDKKTTENSVNKPNKTTSKSTYLAELSILINEKDPEVLRKFWLQFAVIETINAVILNYLNIYPDSDPSIDSTIILIIVSITVYGLMNFSIKKSIKNKKQTWIIVWLLVVTIMTGYNISSGSMVDELSTIGNIWSINDAYSKSKILITIFIIWDQLISTAIDLIVLFRMNSIIANIK